MPAAATTLSDLFWDSVRLHGESKAQAWHEDGAWKDRTYAEFGRAVRDLAHAMLASGAKKGDRVAVWSRNSPKWAEADFAALTAGLVTVPIYDTLTGEKAAYILSDSGARVLLVEDAAMLARLDGVRRGLKGLKDVVVLSGAAPEGKGIHTYDGFRALGRDWGRDHPDRLEQASQRVAPDDLASLVYTSGTTAEPKGVMLSHGNFASNATVCLSLVEVTPRDRFLSFLPLSHVFERTGGHFLAYGAGAQVFYARSLDTLMEDMQAAKPTIMMCVPRLYEKIHARVKDNVAKQSWLKRKLFSWAIGIGMEANRHREKGEPIPARLQRRMARAHRIVLHKLHARVGGELRYFVSGGAALSREIEEFFWAAGIQVLQGYGLTETSPVTNVNLPGAIRFGSVGRCVPGTECRIDTSEWDWAGKPHPEGEICFRGPNVMQGYWGSDKATREVMDADGWFHTGDIGYLDPDGFLYITDRKKEIIVMSNGKKVPPQPIENQLRLQPHIAQACLVGDGRNYVSALVVPDWEALDRFAIENAITAPDRERMAADQRVVSLIEREVEAVNSRLSRFEQVKKFWILPHDWTVESGELTPSLKLKRRVIAERYASEIDRLYPDGRPMETVARAVKA
jgi:long-chain acyl-CoA synthetase